MKWPPLPKVIKTPLIGFNYKVIITDDFDEDDVDGHIDLDKGIIKINKALRLPLQWESLIHEMGHVVEQITGMKPLKDNKGDSDMERFAMGWTMILVANGWIGGRDE